MLLVNRRKSVVKWLSLVFSTHLFLFVSVMPVIGAEISVPHGTSVLLVVEELISPETHQVGQRVFLRVAADVKIDDTIVVKKGAVATGEVSVSNKRGLVGSPAEIGITMHTVEAVDGTVIPLSGRKVLKGEAKQTQSIIITILCCVLALLQKGGKAEIIVGSQIQAIVVGTTTINVK